MIKAVKIFSSPVVCLGARLCQTLEFSGGQYKLAQVPLLAQRGQHPPYIGISCRLQILKAVPASSIEANTPQ
jgi:hypothetical protein